MTIAPWTFAQPPAAARHANVTLFVFGEAFAAPVPSREKYGVPSAESIAAIDVRKIERATDPRWFDAFRAGSMRNIAATDLGDAIAALDAATTVHAVIADVTAPADLTYLQAAWAVARSLVGAGGTVVLDAHAIQYVRGGALPAAGAPLDPAFEVRIVYETESTRPDQAHALHTRGMRKFGAPDLVALCSDGDAPLVSTAFGELAAAMARGLELGAPRHKVDVMPGVHWVVVPDEHSLGELLQLNNAARVVVDSDGHDLVGVADRLRRRPS